MIRLCRGPYHTNKKRGLIEKIFGKVKENRRLTAGYEKSDINLLGFILAAFIKIFLHYSNSG
jgi:hypothetical protein